MRLPAFDDYRGGGLHIRFVSNPRKPGGAYGVAAHVAALTRLYGSAPHPARHASICPPPAASALAVAARIRPVRRLCRVRGGASPTRAAPERCSRGHPSRRSGRLALRSCRRLAALCADLSDNSGHHWNQFFDNHLGFYVGRSDTLAACLLRDGVPFFTGQV